MIKAIKIAEKMIGYKPIPDSLTDRLIEVDHFCRRAGGDLRNKKTIEGIINTWKRDVLVNHSKLEGGK